MFDLEELVDKCPLLSFKFLLMPHASDFPATATIYSASKTGAKQLR